MNSTTMNQTDMNRTDMNRTTIVMLLALSAAAAACGANTDTAYGPGVTPARDAATPTDAAPSTDAPPVDDATPVDDALAPNDVDPPVSMGWMPPDGTDPTCVSGLRWTRGNRGSTVMNPGQACIACHSINRGAPTYRTAGTAYFLQHEVNNCNGYGGTVPGGEGGPAYVEFVDANGTTVRVAINTAGNFYTTRALVFPLRTARVIGPSGAINEMTSAVPNGDCNGCHTTDGTSTVTGNDPAPGRIIVPF